MKALSYDKLEGFQGIKTGDVPVPEISGKEVLVRVKAFSLTEDAES
jgi:NADPH:quinone reductase-like Zn-dependent oxidoreductase